MWYCFYYWEPASRQATTCRSHLGCIDTIIVSITASCVRSGTYRSCSLFTGLCQCFHSISRWLLHAELETWRLAILASVTASRWSSPHLARFRAALRRRLCQDEPWRNRNSLQHQIIPGAVLLVRRGAAQATVQRRPACAPTGLSVYLGNVSLSFWSGLVIG